MRLSFSLAELLPHRPPMVLIDEIVELDVANRAIKTAFMVRECWSGNWTAIEYMAQTAAALAGAFDWMENASRPARPGFLLGTRHLTLKLSRFEVGAIYQVTARSIFEDANAASFACEITDAANKVVATATLNAFRPDDVTKFLKEMT